MTPALVAKQVCLPSQEDTASAPWAVSRASGHLASSKKIWYLFQQQLVIPEFIVEFAYFRASEESVDAAAAAAIAAALAKQPEALRPMCHDVATQLALADCINSETDASKLLPSIPSACASLVQQAVSQTPQVLVSKVPSY
jgi:hypothetical protein